MPNIRELQAPSDLGIRPDDRAQEATANSGRRIAALYDTAAGAINDTGRRAAGAVADVGNVAVKFMESREISQGAAESAKTLAGLDGKWNDTVKNADPNDPAVAAKFKEETVEPILEKLKSGFMTEGGQKYAEAQIESLRSHFNTKTSADMARLAGVAAKTNIETLTNQLSNAAISDPTSLKTALGMVEHSVGAMVDSSPNLRGADGAAMKLELTQSSQAAIVKAAAIGAIATNPEAGLKQFSSPEYSKYISGAELRQLEQQAKAVQRAERVDETYRRTMEKQAKTDASDQREGEYLAKLHSDDPKVAASVSAKAIANDLTMTREARERFIGIVERETKPEPAARVSNETASSLVARMRLPEGDPRRISDLAPIYDAYEKQQLTKSDLKFLRDEFKESRTPEGESLSRDRGQFFKQYAGAIAGRSFDPVAGSPKLYAAEMDARRLEQDLRKAGKDPHLAYDPSSEYFFGKPSRIGKYAGSMQSDLADKAALPPPTKRDDAMPAIPPADQRSPGLYETPKGKLRWTGTGWIAP